MTVRWTLTTGAGPIVATAIHDGHGLRAEVAERVALDDAGRLREEDPHTGAWTVAGDHRVVVDASRFEVDLNRPREAAVYRRPEDAWGLRVWREPLPADVVERSLALYDRFYAQVHALCRRLVDEHGGFLLLDVHSYNHRRGGPDAPPDDPAGNPDVNVGTGSMPRDRWGPLVDRLVSDLRAATSVDVRENVRFRGGRLSRWVHETFPDQGCAVALEFKKTFMDEWTGELFPDRLGRLVDGLRSAIPALRESLRELT